MMYISNRRKNNAAIDSEQDKNGKYVVRACEMFWN